MQDVVHWKFKASEAVESIDLCKADPMDFEINSSIVFRPVRKQGALRGIRKVFDECSECVARGRDLLGLMSHR